ncbi:hypothetical protein ACFXC8_08505 [Streptomyces sp. NPDC059441]|jgi:hypothetical protein|uniref:hypothetical protein n=1 Tax=unclassified Streptomyces TaxID=2593676 RepID=UPI00224F0949|nr:hypothetical protein [Streptomyces sp. NBC_00365]MCX5096993.1 hypothetical protein [Streptomyces sp. NBC_00365]
MDLDGCEKACPGGRQSPYSEEFEKDAVALYCAAGGERTHVAMADDLEITGAMLRM